MLGITLGQAEIQVRAWVSVWDRPEFKLGPGCHFVTGGNTRYRLNITLGQAEKQVYGLGITLEQAVTQVKGWISLWDVSKYNFYAGNHFGTGPNTNYSWGISLGQVKIYGKG